MEGESTGAAVSYGMIFHLSMSMRCKRSFSLFICFSRASLRECDYNSELKNPRWLKGPELPKSLYKFRIKESPWGTGGAKSIKYP